VGEPRPAPLGLRWRAPSRTTIGCVAVCALLLLVAGADLAHTESRLPDYPSRSCPPNEASCFNAQLSEGVARDRAAEPLQRRYDSRAWVYASAILATIAIATAWTLRTNPRVEWPRVFTNLGVIGVWLGIGAVVLLLLTDGNSIVPPAGPLLMLPVVMLVTAAAGTLIGRSEGWAGQNENGVRDRVIQVGKLAIHLGTAGQVKRSRMEELAQWLAYTALGLSVVTCILALVFVLAQPDCSSTGGPPQWTDPIDSAAAVAAIAGMAAAVGALILRRWIAALITLVACPVALLFVLLSTCALS
jgi:hypothetical protein